MCVLMCLASLVMYADQQTAYEKKVDQINRKYYCLFTYGYERRLTTQDEYNIAAFGASLAAANYVLEYPTDGEKLIKMMNQELESAKSLKTDEDIQKEWMNSEHGKAIQYIKSQCDELFVKSEFETQNEYYARIKDESQVIFDRICESLFAEMRYSLTITIEPKKYNAETKLYTLNINEKYSLNEKTINKTYATNWKATVEEAKSFKECTLTGKEIKNPIWSIVDNKDILVTSFDVTLGDRTIHITNNKVHKQLCFEFDKTGVDNINLKGYQWCSAKSIEDSKMDKKIEEWVAEYRCYNLTLHDLIKAYLHNKLPAEEECSKMLWKRDRGFGEYTTERRFDKIIHGNDNNANYIYRPYFIDYEEFHNYYQLGSMESVFESRKNLAKGFSFIIEDLNGAFDYQHERKFLNCMTSTSKESKLINAIKNENEYIQSIGLNYQQFYEYFIGCAFETDPKLNKEFAKNGKYFADKTSFFEAYCSGNYSAILKEKK